MVRLVYLRFRAMGKLYFVVPLGLFVLLPILCWLAYQQPGNSAYLDVADYLEQLGVLLCVWWPCAALKEDMEGDGNELLFMYMGKKGRRPVCDLANIGWYLLHFWLIGSMLLLVDGRYGMFLVRTTGQIVFIWSACYLLIGLLQSTAIPLMLSVGYFLGGHLIEADVRGKLTIFEPAFQVTWQLVQQKTTILLCIGLVFCAVALALMRRPVK